MNPLGRALRRTCEMYLDGVRSMTLGRTLWWIVIVKLAILFGLFKTLFFADPLEGMAPRERSMHLLEQLTGGTRTHEP